VFIELEPMWTFCGCGEVEAGNKQSWHARVRPAGLRDPLPNVSETCQILAHPVRGLSPPPPKLEGRHPCHFVAHGNSSHRVRSYNSLEDVALVEIGRHVNKISQHCWAAP